MPYSHTQIPLKDHKPYCSNPKTDALYRRTNNEKGNRTWVVRGLECPSCGFIITLSHNNNLTKKQLMSMSKSPKILSENERLEIKSEEEIEREYLQGTKEIELKRIRTREVQNVVSHEEKKFRAKIKAFNTMYKNDEKYCPRLKGKIKWDRKLVERFLDIRPSQDEMFAMLNWPPLHRYSNKKANRRRGCIPHPDHFGYIKYDNDCYNIKWYELRGKSPGLINPNELSEFEKLVIDEAQGRMEYMENIIKKHLEYEIQVYHPVQDEDEDKKQRVKNSIS